MESFQHYHQAVEWLFGQIPMFQNEGSGAYKPGLERVVCLSSLFGNPHLRLKTIHVAGTNGKGSVSSLLASVHQEAGLKTGLFTSPHLIDFRERIRIDGLMIPEHAVLDFINRYRNLDIDFEPSFFELTTVMAFEWFARNNVDIAVIEVGLGGRLDSTNIITPVLSVITNISLDHTALLGPDEACIASEKAGIIKPGVPVVIGNATGAVAEVFENKADEEGAPIIFACGRPWYRNMRCDGTYFIYESTPWGDIFSPLNGDCQPENAATVFAALSVLGWNDSEAVARGFSRVCRNTGLTGRWSVLSDSPAVICDTGHNPGGWQWIGPRLEKISRERPLFVVAGFVSDKDVSSILEMMPRKARYFWATPSVKRGLDSAVLCDRAGSFGLIGDAFPSVESAYRAAMKEATPASAVFVGGSTFVVADLLAALDKV